MRIDLNRILLNFDALWFNSPVKVAIDIRRMNEFGVGTYTRNVIRALGRQDHESEYFLLGPAERAAEIGFLPANFKVIPLQQPETPISSFLRYRATIKRLQCSLVHIPHLFWMPRHLRCPYVMTVHDVLEHLSRARGLSALRRALHFQLTRQVLKGASRIFAVSAFTKNEIVNLFGISARHIEVIYNAIDERFLHGHASEADRKLLAERYQAAVNGASEPFAATQDDLAMADLLIKAGARAAARTREGVTPLQLAAVNGSASMIDRLLKSGADANAPLTTAGDTALMMAARTGKTEALRVLVEAGANVNAKESWGGTTALMWAVSEGHPEAAKLLIDAGADVNARSNYVAAANGRGFEGRTPLANRTDGKPEEFASGWLTPGLITSSPVQKVKKMLQPPFSGGSRLDRRATTLPQSVATNSTFMPALRSMSLPTWPSAFSVGKSVAASSTTFSPL